jgi:MtN3 and saliva related transmembrane protein
MELLGYIGTVLTISAFLPQAVKTVRTRQTRDLSLPTYVLLVTSALVWTIYGVGTDSLPIAITNATVFLASSVVLVLKLKQEYL